MAVEQLDLRRSDRLTGCAQGEAPISPAACRSCFQPPQKQSQTKCSYNLQVAFDVNVGSANAVPEIEKQVTEAVSTGSLQVRAPTSNL